MTLRSEIELVLQGANCPLSAGTIANRIQRLYGHRKRRSAHDVGECCRSLEHMGVLRSVSGNYELKVLSK